MHLQSDRWSPSTISRISWAVGYIPSAPNKTGHSSMQNQFIRWAHVAQGRTRNPSHWLPRPRGHSHGQRSALVVQRPGPYLGCPKSSVPLSEEGPAVAMHRVLLVAIGTPSSEVAAKIPKGRGAAFSTTRPIPGRIFWRMLYIANARISVSRAQSWSSAVACPRTHFDLWQSYEIAPSATNE